MTDTLCAACRSGPSGIDGHADLMAQNIGSECLSFKCGRCQSLWVRCASPNRKFTWTSIDSITAAGPTMGISLPRRTKTGETSQ
jgi:hypothetical protein